MRIILSCIAAAVVSTAGLGCGEPFTQPEKVESQFVPLTNRCAAEISRQALADKIGQPASAQPFGDHAVYMGDYDGYHYVHVRDMYDCKNFLGDRDYKIKAADWPMSHPMPLTEDTTQWQDLEWMNGDAADGVVESPFLHLTPHFPLGAPGTQPSTSPATATAPAQ